MAEVARCNRCEVTYDDPESIEQTRKWLAESEPYAPCPNFDCPGELEIIETQ